MIGVLGGTGRQGSALARRYAALGEDVIVGTRSPATATQFQEANVRVATNLQACDADVIFLALPWSAALTTLESLAEALAGKQVVSMINPLAFDTQGVHPLIVAEGSAAQAVQLVLPDSGVAIAFNLVSSAIMNQVTQPLNTDVPICASDPETYAVVAEVVGLSGAQAFDAGPLSCAVAIEAMTAVILREAIHSVGQ